jgi:excinuclease UvrABC nuclease subunit
MPINSSKASFTKANVDNAPAEAGVYGLYDSSGKAIYFGRAKGDTVTIRSRLQSHQRGDEGACTQGASQFNYEKTTSPVMREKELIDEFKKANGGKLPKCNEVTP